MEKGLTFAVMNMCKAYDKPPLTYAEQVGLLKARGLCVDDEKTAERVLANISYYRLSAYMVPYKRRENGVPSDTFKEGTTWEMVYGLYRFDRSLRLLVFDAIERLEVAVRAQIIYQLSHKYGAHWQDRRDIFVSPREITLRNGKTVRMDVYGDIQKHIKEQLHSNKAETFIQHYRHAYGFPENPPSWMSIEIMYLNHLSRICHGLQRRSDINGIAAHFALPPQTFCSWLHTLNYVRNICAHHARLWNRELQIVPERLSFSKRLNWITNPQTAPRGKLYYLLCMLNYLLQTVHPESSFKTHLKMLLWRHQKNLFLHSMGFPDGWEQEKMWMPEETF